MCQLLAKIRASEFLDVNLCAGAGEGALRLCAANTAATDPYVSPLFGDIRQWSGR